VLLKPNSITLVGSELVRSWFEPDSAMEFGFYKATLFLRSLADSIVRACT